jgi:hypothetical protein
VEEDLLEVSARRAETARPRLQLLVARAAARRELHRGAPDPAIDRIGVEAVEAEEEDAVGDLRTDAG